MIKKLHMIDDLINDLFVQTINHSLEQKKERKHLIVDEFYLSPR